MQLLFLTNACADELLINGDFESPAIAADSFEITNPDSWAGTGDIRIFNGNYGSPGFPGPVNGQQYMSFGNNGSGGARLSQTFTVANSGTYLLIWFDNTENNPGTMSPYSVTVSNATTVVVSSNFVVSGDAPNWFPQFIGLSLSAGSYTLEFRSRQLPFGNSTLIDSVSLQGTSSQASGLLFYGLNKGRLFTQTGAAAPVPDSNNPFSLFAFAADRNPNGNGINSVTMDFPGGPLGLIPQATERKISALIDREALVSFSTQSTLDASFPNGDFTFNFDTVQDGVFSSAVTLNGDSYPGAPHVSNFTAAQVIDPTVDFVLKWDPFVGGTTNDAIHVSIYEGTSLVFETSFLSDDFAGLNGRATSLLIPSYTLKGLTTYHGVITFVKGVTANLCTCGSGFAGYQSTTKFDLQTAALRRSPSDIFPIAVTGVNELAYDMAFGGGNYLVAMLGRQNLDQNSSDHGEVLAVLVGRDGTVRRTSATGHFSGNTRVAFGGQRFLLVWDDDQNIFGQFVATDGEFIDPPFQISNDPFGTEQPDVTFDGTNFLVAWTASDGSGGNNNYTQPRALLIAPDGTFLTGEIPLGSGNGAFNVEVAAGGGRFLAVAVDSDTESGVYGQFLDASGALIGSVINIDTSSLNSGGPKNVFFDPIAQRFIVTFGDGSTGEARDLFARTIDLNGTVGPRKTIATGTGFQGAAKIATDGHSLLMTWVDGIFSPVGISHARFFDSDLNPLSADMIAFVQHSNKFPFIAPVQFDGSRYLIVNSVVQVLTDNDGEHDFVNGDAYGRFILPNAPGIATPPRDQTIAVGANVTFTVEATGPPPLTYQWQRNGVNIPGATSNRLDLIGVSLADAGAFFRVLVSNGSGTTTSQASQLIVLQPPVIVQQPQSALSATSGDEIIFSVIASGDEPLQYQWHLNGINIPNATSADLTLSAAIETQGSYSVSVANPVGATNSIEASLALQADPIDFQDNFADRSIIENIPSASGAGSNVGATKEFAEPNHAGKTGGASVWISWRAPNDGVVTFATTGSSFDTLLAVYTGSNIDQLTPVVSDDDSGGAFASRVTFNAIAGTEYILAIDGLGGRVGRIFLSWSLDTSEAAAPIIVSSPPSQTVPTGSTVSLEVTVQSASATTFQWFKDGVPLTDRTSNPLVISSFQKSDIGSYVVRVRNASTVDAFSGPAFLELGNNPNLSTSDKFEDAGLERIVIGAASLRDTRASALTGPSAGTVITHNYGATRESGEPNNGGVLGGASLWFALRPNTTGMLAIDTVGSDFDTVLAVYSNSVLQLVAQDNNGAPDGVRSSVRFNASAGVDYLAAVDGVNGAQGSVTLNYHFGTPPQIVSASANSTVAVGADFSLHAVAATAADLSYQWKFNGVSIPDATNADLTVARCQLLDQGTYTIEVSNPLGTAARAIAVTVSKTKPKKTHPKVVLTAPLSSAVLVPPTNIQLVATATGDAISKVEFFVNKTNKVGEATAAPYTAGWTIPAPGKYSLTAKVTDGIGATKTSKAVKIIGLARVSITKQPQSLSIVAGATAKFTVTATGSKKLNYQWLFNGTPIPKATKASLSVRRVQAGQVGSYSVRITNPAGSLESDPATLTLAP